MLNYKRLESKEKRPLNNDFSVLSELGINNSVISFKEEKGNSATYNTKFRINYKSAFRSKILISMEKDLKVSPIHSEENCKIF